MGSKQSQVIGQILTPAVKLWLRSQVKAVEDLKVKIEANDRQLLAGVIRRLSIKGRKVIYRGLHLHKVKLEARKIRTNLPQVIRGQLLQLVEPVPVICEVQIQETDLKASLKKKSLLVNGLNDLLCQLLKARGAIAEAKFFKKHPPSWQEIAMEGNHLTITGSLPNAEGNPTSMTISSYLELASSDRLLLSSLEIQTSADLNSVKIDSFPVDLGPEVNIKNLRITRNKLACLGIINVLP